ncbi:MAG: hemerythrin domain-containing protein [Desulfotomaculaceae bacterium]|nr:hemerythrin domain-containing protein [Desulfotomaculaceae bacterium]
MYWLKRFHDDHANLGRIVSKLEGNLKDIEYGEAGVNVIWELREFVELVHNVVIPHFKAEEQSVYPRLSAGASEDRRGFIAGLYEEHNQLYEAFEGFAKALLDIDYQEDKAGRGRKIADEMARSGNIDKMEAPKNFDKITQTMNLEENIDKETLLQNGFVIIQLLEKHIKKEKKVAEETDGSEKNSRTIK